MKAGYGELKAGSDAVSAALGAARSARNRATRERAADARETSASARRYKRTRAREDRERERAMNRRFRVQVADTDRPRMKGRTPHRLFYRLGGQAMGTRITASSSGGTRSIHFAVTARGFASRTGRAWRGGEGERAALYIVREDALEGGEVGWWSNVAADRNELAAFHRASEAFEHHDRANANVYMSEVIALPDSLSARQRRKAVRRYCQTLDSRGLGYTVAMHLPDPNGDGRNYHCHIVYSLRPVTRLGAYDWSLAASKVADVNTPDGIRARRGLAVAAINATLKAAGSAQRYTDASNRARGLGSPSPKQGQRQTWALRRAAVAEARLAALARLQAATSTLRAGLAVLSRAETARVDIRNRLRGLQDGNTAALADADQRMAAVRIRVRDGLTHELTLETAADPGSPIAVAKSNVVDALAGAMAGFTSPDAFAARIAAVASARTRRKARRQADAEALTAAADTLAAAPPRDVESWRTDVVTGLSAQAVRIDATRQADRQRIIDLASASPPVDRAQLADHAAPRNLPAAPAPARAAGTAPDHTPSIKLPSPTATMPVEERAGAAARETARIPDILERAFARLAAPGVRFRLGDNGGYQLPAGLLDAEERAALQHADYHAEIRARLAGLYAAQCTVDARGATPESDAAPSPVASLPAPMLAPAATAAPVPIPAASHDEDLAVLQAAKDLQDAIKGR